MSCVVIVFAKRPVAGAAKTRLIPALGAEGAARLAARMLAHSLAEAVAAQIGPVELCLDVEPTHPDAQRWRGRAGVNLTNQGEGDLGERMQRALARALAHAPRALLIGTDVPALDRTPLRAAAEALTAQDAVFVPTEDGGYGLVGLRADPAAGLQATLASLFESVPWSTPEVMAVTRDRLAAAGLDWAELPALADVDTPADLYHVPAAWLA